MIPRLLRAYLVRWNTIPTSMFFDRVVAVYALNVEEAIQRARPDIEHYAYKNFSTRQVEITEVIEVKP